MTTSEGTVGSFPTVDELRAFCRSTAACHPDRVTLVEVGRSRLGEPIELLSLCSAASHGEVLVIGQPHPNEPIGMVTIMTLCGRLLADTSGLDGSGVNWHFVPCADPDGTRLNEGWFSGPFTREHYARHFFRPGTEAQVEWTFPLDINGRFSVDRPMPETVALMNAINLARPTVMASLHNAELGGAYFYATADADPLYPRLTELCQHEGIPLHLGEPEFPLSEVLAPAVFSVPTGAQMYELAMAAGIDPTALVTGGSSLDYARTQGFDPVGVVIELPYWRDERASDTSPHPSGVTRREAVLSNLEAEKDSIAKVRSLFERAAPLPPSPFSAAVGSFLHLEASGYGQERQMEAENNPDFERPATIAEVFTSSDEHHSYRLRMLGMLMRAVPPRSPLRPEIEELLQRWSAESEAGSRSEVIPIEKLVAVQAGSILRAVEFAHPA
jgi:hypothetical protein